MHKAYSDASIRTRMARETRKHRLHDFDGFNSQHSNLRMEMSMLRIAHVRSQHQGAKTRALQDYSKATEWIAYYFAASWITWEPDEVSHVESGLTNGSSGTTQKNHETNVYGRVVPQTFADLYGHI
eukprot:5439330-Amphidinium_carterae.1